MILKIFTVLTRALEASPSAALAAAFVWGVLSILLSPCHLAGIPLVVGFINEQRVKTAGRAFLLSLLFAAGILVTIGVIGLITGLAGRMLGDIGRWGNIFVAALFFIIGLHLLGVIPLPFMGNSNAPQYRQKGTFAALVMGLLFGVAIGPCTFAYMAPMLGIVFKMSASRLLFGILLIFFYALGHCSIIVLAGTFTEVVQKYLNWTGSSKGALWLRRVCGILVILGGITMIVTG